MDDLSLLTAPPVRLVLLDHGTFRVTAGPEPRTVLIPGWLISTAAGEHVLVDGGFPEKYLTHTDRAAAADGLGAFGRFLAVGPRNGAAAQLALCGIAPSDVGLHVLTHTHIDHLGGLGVAPDAPVVIGAPERAMARPDPIFQPAGEPMEWPDRDWRPVSGAARLGPGIEAHVAPGHAAGQLALLVEVPGTRPVMLLSDAASRPAEVMGGFVTTEDRDRAVASAARLLALAAERDAQVIWGHCPEQRLSLPRAPAPLRERPVAAGAPAP